MAASMHRVSLSTTVIFFLRQIRTSGAVNRMNAVRHLSSKESAQEEKDNIESQEADAELEMEVKRLRDVSGLPMNLKRQLRKQVPIVTLEKEDYGQVFKYPQTWAFQKEVFGKHGLSSGIDPRKLFPRKSELAEMIEDEKFLEIDFQSTIQEIEKEKQEKEKATKEREATVKKNLEKMEKMIQDLKQKEQKRIEKEEELANKEKRLLEEAREILGYTPKMHDPKYIEFVEQKEEQEKLEAKQKKKEKQKEKRLKIEMYN